MKREVKIGLTVMAALLIAYIALSWIKNVHLFSSPSAQYSIRFQDVNGLKPGDVVTVFGYPSGKVEAIRLTQQGAVADISLSTEVQLRQDAHAEILVKELMGGKQVEVKPGLSPTPLPPGSTLNGSTSLDFSTAFDRMGEFMSAFDPQQMDTLVRNLNAVSESFAHVGQRIERQDIDGTFGDLRSSAQQLNAILAEVQRRKLVARLDSAFLKLESLADKGEQTMATVNDLGGHLQEKTLPEAEALMQQISAMLTDTEVLMADTRDALERAKSKRTVAGRLLYDEQATAEFDLLMDNLNETLEFLRTKKVHVAMSLVHRQKQFGDEAGEGAIKQEEK